MGNWENLLNNFEENIEKEDEEDLLNDPGMFVYPEALEITHKIWKTCTLIKKYRKANCKRRHSSCTRGCWGKHWWNPFYFWPCIKRCGTRRLMCVNYHAHVQHLWRIKKVRRYCQKI